MLGINARPVVAKVINPVVTLLARAGVTPDMITITGTLGAVLSAAFLIGTGRLFWGAFAVTLFVLLDLFDGALARSVTTGRAGCARPGGRLSCRARRRRGSPWSRRAAAAAPGCARPPA